MLQLLGDLLGLAGMEVVGVGGEGPAAEQEYGEWGWGWWEHRARAWEWVEVWISGRQSMYVREGGDCGDPPHTSPRGA